MNYRIIAQKIDSIFDGAAGVNDIVVCYLKEVKDSKCILSLQCSKDISLKSGDSLYKNKGAKPLEVFFINKIVIDRKSSIKGKRFYRLECDRLFLSSIEKESYFRG